MKKLFAIISFCFFMLNMALAQKPAKSVYVELGGPGLASLNYDMRFQKKEDGLGFRVGVGGYAVKNDFGYGSDRTSILLLPVAVNYLLGKDHKNYLEIGAGYSYVSIANKSNFYQDDQFSTSFGHLHFGYRLQPANGGFTFRAGITPIFNKFGFIPYYASLSFGYKF